MLLLILIATVSILAVLHAPFIWWFVLCGARSIVLPTDSEGIIVLSAGGPDDVIVDVVQDPGEDEEIEVLVDID